MRSFAIVFLVLFRVSAAEPFRLSVSTMPVSAPAYYAREMGLFKEAGLNVELCEYSLGKFALEDLEAGRLEAACAAVTPLVYKFMANGDFRIIGSIASSTGMVAVVARKDLGIHTFANIEGKRIGVAKGSSSEFFFEAMRILNRVPRGRVHVEDRSVDDLVDGIKDGTLDAISIWEPQIDALKVSLTNKLSLFYANGFYTFTWNLVTSTNTLKTRRGDLEKFMKVMFAAADRIRQDPETARNTLVERLGKRGREMSIGLNQTRFDPQLGQELLVQMEGEARWIVNRDARTNVVPNFLRRIDTSVLKKVKPSAVSIIE